MEAPAQVLSVNFAKIFKAAFSQSSCEHMFLSMSVYLSTSITKIMKTRILYAVINRCQRLSQESHKHLSWGALQQ